MALTQSSFHLKVAVDAPQDQEFMHLSVDMQKPFLTLFKKIFSEQDKKTSCGLVVAVGGVVVVAPMGSSHAEVVLPPLPIDLSSMEPY